MQPPITLPPPTSCLALLAISHQQSRISRLRLRSADSSPHWPPTRPRRSLKLVDSRTRCTTARPPLTIALSPTPTNCATNGSSISTATVAMVTITAATTACRAGTRSTRWRPTRFLRIQVVIQQRGHVFAVMCRRRRTAEDCRGRR